MFRSGACLEAPVLLGQLGYEASGEVEAVGEGVSTIPVFSMTKCGVYGDAAMVSAHAVVKHPTSMSWPQAAAIWMQYLTAYGAVIQIGSLIKDNALITTAASSSVGLAAIQIAIASQAESKALRKRSCA